MARTRIGLGFEGTLYHARLGPVTMLDLGRAPPALAMEHLVAAACRYELVIYPLWPALGLTSAIRGWVLTQLERYFENLGHLRAAKMALGLVDQIDFVADKHAIAVDFSIDIAEIPRPELLGVFVGLAEATIAPPATVE